MPEIHLTTFIAAPVERVFDLSRSINLHRVSMTKFKEKSIRGRMNGLLQLHDTVTWSARHLWKTRILQIKITRLLKPSLFIDEQVFGDFKSMKHEHFFKPCENGTIMIDQFFFETPYGLLGQWINNFYLTHYMKGLIEVHNEAIRKAAESNQWKHYLIGNEE